MNPFNFSYSITPSQNFHQRQQQSSTQQSSQQKNVILPEISTDTFIESAKEVNVLLREAVLLSNHIIQTDIGRQIMEAAQNSETDKIEDLLRQIGITQRVKISYTPHSISFQTTPMNNPELGLQTTLTMKLIWNKTF